MVPFGIFRKKEKETAVKPAQKTLLEELCEGNDELYQALSRIILLNPQLTMKEGIDSYIERGQEYEKTGDSVRARVAYQVAGEICLYEGKLVQVQKFFKKAAEADPSFENRNVFEYLSRKENAERALAVAQEFYIKTGKRRMTTESSSA
jgi:tetratricopeptide (TPR) repeat protein